MTATAAIKKLSVTAAGSAGRLGKIWTPLWRFLTLSPADDAIAPRKAVSVSLEKGRLSIVYGSRFLSWISIRGIKEYPYDGDGYPQPEEVAASLSLAVNELGASREEVTLSIPRAWAIIRTAEFPSTINENIAAAVSYEMDRLTPFIPEEAFYDFRVLNDTGEKLILMIAAAKADTIRPYIQILNENGFTVTGLTVNLEGIGTLCHYLERKTDTLFVEINEKRYEGALFVGGSTTRVFSGDVTACDERVKAGAISKEIMRLTDAAKTSRGRAPQVVALVKDRNPALKEFLKAQMNTPVRFIEEMISGMKFPVSLGNVPYAAAGSVVQSLWPQSKGLNLLRKGVYQKQKTPIGLTVIFAIALAVLWVLYMGAPLKIEKKRLQEIIRQIGPKKEEVRKVEALKKEADALNSEIASINDFKARPMDLNILKELTAVLPKNTWLTRVRITDTTVEIEGYASSATELLPKLEGSKYMRKVEFASPTFRDVRMNSDRFNIRMEITGSQKKEDKNKGDKGKSEKK
jgi:Tfp pilus assembly protein PilN